MLETVKRDPSSERLHPPSVFITCRMTRCPLLQLAPVLAHSILSIARAPVLIQARVSWRVICITHNLLPETVEAVVDMREV